MFFGGAGIALILDLFISKGHTFNMKKTIIFIAIVGALFLISATGLAASLSEKWEDAFDGYGNIVKTNRWVYLEPMAASASDETHSALVLAKDYYNATDYTFKTTEYVSRQLRTDGEANPWEVGWIF